MQVELRDKNGLCDIVSQRGNFQGMSVQGKGLAEREGAKCRNQHLRIRAQQYLQGHGILRRRVDRPTESAAVERRRGDRGIERSGAGVWGGGGEWRGQVASKSH